MTDTGKMQEMREAFERTNSRDHRRQPPKGNNYIDPMAQADWESFQKGWQASRLAVELPQPFAVIGDYAACGGGKVVMTNELAEKIIDQMCEKTPVYDLASLVAAGLRCEVQP